jgi:hypothetical protein
MQAFPQVDIPANRSVAGIWHTFAMLRRGFLVFAGLTVSLTAVACSGKGDPPVNTSSVAASSPASSTAASASPTVVPIDQIPPGNPAEWVPAGVPTTAKYQRPGDVVPKFTQDMFKHTQGGALDAARYYFDARNWSQILPSGAPILAICDSDRCKSNAKVLDDLRSSGQRLEGKPESAAAPQVVAAPSSSGAEWVVQSRVSIPAGNIVDSRNRVVRSTPATTKVYNVYLKWNGTMWRVSNVSLAG